MRNRIEQEGRDYGKDGVYRSHMVFSDDGGKTWKRGAALGKQIGECHVVEKQDGSLVLKRAPTRGRSGGPSP